MTDPQRLYGEHTISALSNSIPGTAMSTNRQIVAAYVLVKKACAATARDLGLYEASIADAIMEAADEVLAGEHHEAFVTPLIVGGGGTSTNMNVNEVLATLATRRLGDGKTVHPNDHVNRAQSSNDTYPTAMALSLYGEGLEAIEELSKVPRALREKAQQYEGEMHLGRTCLNDAVELPISETHRAQALGFDRTVTNLSHALEQILEVPLGGTAVGSGVGAPEGYGNLAVQYLAKYSGIAVKVPSSRYDVMANADTFSNIASACRQISQMFYKVAGDLRFLASGPRGGINEINLPRLQAGSSIMPGKVNPTLPELVMNYMLVVRGLSHAVDEAVDAGELEINVMAQVMLQSLHEIFGIYQSISGLFVSKCIAGFEWRRDILKQKLATSFDERVTRAEVVGYEQVATVQAEPR